MRAAKGPTVGITGVWSAAQGEGKDFLYTDINKSLGATDLRLDFVPWLEFTKAAFSKLFPF